jgi:hypothetical protein
MRLPRQPSIRRPLFIGLTAELNLVFHLINSRPFPC